jgi:micrococcal nuclease
MILYARYRAASWVCLWVLVLALCLPAVSFAHDTATVVKVVDGDTLDVTLNGQTERVRLIGVDTPEVYETEKLRRDVARTGQDKKTIQALGKRASAFTKTLVPLGTQVHLEYDQQRRDRDNRLLVFMWISDGRMLNETIICEGYANALTRYPFRSDYMERFRTCERQAREQSKGLWGDGLVQDTVATAP